MTETTEGVQKEYVGSTVHFKKRYYGHTNSIRNDVYKHSTTLSTYVWHKDLNPNPRIKWKIAGRASSYKKGGRQCDLCLTEKLFILKNFNNPNYLNKRSELALKCRHKAKFLLIPPTDRVRNSTTRTWELGYRVGVQEQCDKQPMYPVQDHVTFCHMIRKRKSG